MLKPAVAAAKPAEYFPPPSFRFRLLLNGSRDDGSFQEISGLKVEWTTEDVAEGGQNRFVHRLPLRTKYGNALLKRGVVLKGSAMADWFAGGLSANFLSKPVEPRTATILLLDAAGGTLVEWTLVRAVPVSWEHSALSASENNLLIETLELSYDFFNRRTWPPKG